MKKTILLLAILAGCAKVFAQETVTLKAGGSLEDFKKKYMYKYPVFVSSRVIHNDGVVTHGKLNYNQFRDKMEFIGPKGDTLELVNNNVIKEVMLDSCQFYYDSGYYEVIITGTALKLARQKPIRLIDRQKIGALGQASSMLSAQTVDRVDFASGQKVNIGVDYIFSIAPVYYFGDANSSFLPATQKNLQRILPDKKDVIAGYMKNNHVNFSKIEDILSLLTAIKVP